CVITTHSFGSAIVGRRGFLARRDAWASRTSFCATTWRTFMPAYSNALPPSAIWPGDFAQVWNAEQPAPGSGGASASQRVAVGTKEGGPAGFAVTGFFSGAPGAFEIDVQVSDVDADAQYQTLNIGP